VTYQGTITPEKNMMPFFSSSVDTIAREHQIRLSDSVKAYVAGVLYRAHQAFTSFLPNNMRNEWSHWNNLEVRIRDPSRGSLDASLVGDYILLRTGFFPDTLPPDLEPFQVLGQMAYGSAENAARKLGDEGGVITFEELPDSFEFAASVLEQLRVRTEVARYKIDIGDDTKLMGAHPEVRSLLRKPRNRITDQVLAGLGIHYRTSQTQ